MPKKKIKIKQKARAQKKKGNDSIPKAPAKVYPENAAHFKVSIKKK